jgi:hypothetical protein
MSLVVKNRDSVTRLLAAGLAVLTAVALTGCSRENASREIVRFRDRVVADAATAEAQRSLQPRYVDEGGYGYYRDPLRQEAPKPVGADGKPLAADGPVDPTAPPKPFQSQSAAPPTVYYYQVSPTTAPAQ